MGGGSGHHQEQGAVPEQELSEFGRNGKGQMAMPHVQQTALGVFGRFLGTRTTAGRTEAALTGEADRMGLVAVLAAIADKAVGLGTTAQRFFDGTFGGGGNLRRQFTDQFGLECLPMVAENGLQQSRLVHPIPENTEMFISKCPYFSYSCTKNERVI
jgi:hypothetical protein